MSSSIIISKEVRTYDPKVLIRAIEAHPNLWDRSIPEYKIRSKKQSSWEEIYRTVIDNFDDLSKDDQLEIGATLLNKWHNLRDAFMRSVKKCVQGDTKKYIYTNELVFLVKNLKIDPEEYLKRFDSNYHIEDHNFTCRPQTIVKIEHDSDDMEEEDNTESLLVERKKRKKTDETREYYVEFEQYEEPLIKVDDNLNKEDEAFFASILPTVSKYSEDDRLEFRMDVLSAMKKIRDKYK